MQEHFIQYYFEQKNRKTLFFLPGYTGSLSTPIIEQLVAFYVNKKEYDVLGLEPCYQEDTLDLFNSSQERIRNTINEFVISYPDKKVIIVAKSLGGSLCLYHLNDLKVSGLVILGFPVVLGWPQRISLLSIDNPQVPDYKSEWLPILERIDVPVRIVNGGSDDLTDNGFLKGISEKNTCIRLSVLKDADHGLTNVKTKEVYLDECIREIEYFL